ncbi:MAG: hypothetical protein FJY85_07715 [Deltaproteobacteria bacterium]|nr:hypothetical protein [Deltaproteobacteria bacterium]
MVMTKRGIDVLDLTLRYNAGVGMTEFIFAQNSAGLKEMMAQLKRVLKDVFKYKDDILLELSVGYTAPSEPAEKEIAALRKTLKSQQLEIARLMTEKEKLEERKR